MAERYTSYGSTDGTSITNAATTMDKQQYSLLVEKISTLIFTISNGATTLAHILKQIGTANDGQALRERMLGTQQGTNTAVHSSVQLIRQITSLSKHGDKQQRLHVERLRTEFKESVERYTNMQKLVVNKIKSTKAFLILESKTESSTWDPDDKCETTNLLNQKAEEKLAQKQLNQELEFEQGLLIEREHHIHQIESELLDVNQIFKSLGAMVHEQGEVLNTIGANIEKTFNDVEAGRDQLTQAHQYQNKYRKKLCCFMALILLVGAAVTIIIIIAVKT